MREFKSSSCNALRPDKFSCRCACKVHVISISWIIAPLRTVSINLSNVYAEICLNFPFYHLHWFAFSIVTIVLLILLSKILILQNLLFLALTHHFSSIQLLFYILLKYHRHHEFLLHGMSNFLLYLQVLLLLLIRQMNFKNLMILPLRFHIGLRIFLLTYLPIFFSIISSSVVGLSGKSKALNAADSSIIIFRLNRIIF